MAKAPSVQIRAPGQSKTTDDQHDSQPTVESAAADKPERDPRVALTVKVGDSDYERLMLLKGRKRRSVQALAEAAIKDMLDNEGV